MPNSLRLTFFAFTIFSLLAFSSEGQWEQMRSEADTHLGNENFVEAARLYNLLAFHYWENGQGQAAADNFLLSAEANQSIGNQNAVKHIYNNLGQIFLDLAEYSRAETYINKSLEISRKQGRRQEIMAALTNLANVQGEAGNSAGAIANLEQAKTIAEEQSNMQVMRNIYALLAQHHLKVGNDSKSREYFDLYAAVEQHLQQQQMEQTRQQANQQVSQARQREEQERQEREQTQQQLRQTGQALQQTRETLGEVEQVTTEQRLQIELLDKQNQLKEEELKRRRLIQKVLAGASVVAVLIIFLISYNFLQKKKANRELTRQNNEIARQKEQIESQNAELSIAFEKIKKQNQDIRNSIVYAERIQNAFLPSAQRLKQYVEDYFILFQPRDVVSGDFYWIKYPDKKQDELIITAVDCTGHGVPGAFMSLIGMNILANIIRQGITRANSILEELHARIRKALKQQTHYNQDGMEMSLCILRNNGTEVEFSGARNHLFYIQNGKGYQLKADPLPIGGIEWDEDKRRFSGKVIQINKPTKFYMFTDGFADQYGGPQVKKYSSAKLRQFLLDTHQHPMQKQKQLLEAELKEWMGKERQLDDIMIIAFEVNPDNTRA